MDWVLIFLYASAVFCLIMIVLGFFVIKTGIHGIYSLFRHERINKKLKAKSSIF
ncbi:MAG: hypothetical protein UV40_C0021G0025 [Parcubacteria group bacterium GW2011_GWA1_42_7]|nr:MAG: hypothetical protein UV40_C0021G0025 [Parcubacteria group bacterium GW2011_GWA1_42_7]KKS91449.1 MAG: hypothetical protein UV67_C0027G0010 [Parcubacteria group bacterium GW2011_GWC1_43_12]